MADLSDVMNALVSAIVTATYPNGTASASSSGAPTYVYPGMPVATILDADMADMFAAIQGGRGPAAGRIHVSVYTGNVEQNITKSLDGWQKLGHPANGKQETAKEVRRVKRQFIITIYAPDPQLRDLTGSLIDVALCSLRNLPLADGTVGQIYYGSTALDDLPAKEITYQRKQLYFIEYGTFATQQSPFVTEVIADLHGGFDPHSVIDTITLPRNSP
jgi:hypothetical protein